MSGYPSRSSVPRTGDYAIAKNKPPADPEGPAGVAMIRTDYTNDSDEPALGYGFRDSGLGTPGVSC